MTALLNISTSQNHRHSSITLDDVDKKQMELDKEFESAATRNAAYKIADYADQFVFKGLCMTKDRLLTPHSPQAQQLSQVLMFGFACCRRQGL